MFPIILIYSVPRLLKHEIPIPIFVVAGHDASGDDAVFPCIIRLRGELQQVFFKNGMKPVVLHFLG